MKIIGKINDWQYIVTIESHEINSLIDSVHGEWEVNDTEEIKE